MRNNPARFIYMVAMGLLIGLLLKLLSLQDIHDGHVVFHFFTSVVITILVWEGNLRIDTLMNIRFPWLVHPARRILVHLVTSMTYSTLTIYFSMLFFDAFVCNIPYNSKSALMVSAMVVGVLITFAVLSIEIGSQFFRLWKRSLVEVEKYKTESVQAQLQNLKSQVNPHFLFNNLSVLSSLVYKDQDKAVDFINQLSKVYRYLLETRNCELSTLDEELRFIESYTYLLQIRFGRNLEFKIHIQNEKRHLLLPPMALQMLIENAIKHNEVSSELPLTIEISVKDESLEVRNNLQLRSTREESSHTGLNNIRARYNYYTGRSVEVLQSDRYFTVIIPLLHKQ